MRASRTYGSVRGAPSNGRLYRDWSGRDRCLRVLIVGWMKSLSEAGAERAIVNGAARLQQQIGAAS